MKKTSLFFMVAGISMLLVSCGKHTKFDEEYPFVYSVGYDADKMFDWYSHIEVEKIIPFEFSDSSMISLAQDCQVTKDKIFVQDYKQHILLVYDSTGKYLYSIDNIGNGPGEYLDIRSFCFSAEGNEVILNDGYKLLFYRLSDGSFLRSIPLPLKVQNPERSVLFSSCVNPAENLYYLWTDMGTCSLYMYDGKEIRGLKQRDCYQLGVKKFIRNYKGEYLYCPDYGEFGVSTVDGKKRFYIDFGDKALPSNRLPKNREELVKLDKAPYFKSIMNVQETEKGIYVSALSPINNYYEIYIDKMSGQILQGKLDENTRLNIVQVEGDSFYALFYPYYVNDSSLLKKELASSITLGDNPILLKFRMKPSSR